MSKQVLKIERQPFMPKDAQYWCLNKEDDEQIVNSGCYVVEDDQVKVFSHGKAHKTWHPDFEALKNQWDYVYEITDLGCQQEKINRLNVLVDDYDNSLRIEKDKCRQQRYKIIFLCCMMIAMALLSLLCVVAV